MNNSSIEDIIIKSLEETAKLVSKGACDSAIIIPSYRKKGEEQKERYSEQELKQIFLNCIEKDGSFYYSVETPSRWCYRFKDKEEPKVLLKDEHSKETYQSSRIDISLYKNKDKIVSHIEFKFGSCQIFPIQKDFLKLISESDETNMNYFVHYLSPYNSETEDAIFHKYQESLNNIQRINDNISDITKRLEKITLFVMFVNPKFDEASKIFKITLKDLADLSLPEKGVENSLEKFKCL